MNKKISYHIVLVFCMWLSLFHAIGQESSALDTIEVAETEDAAAGYPDVESVRQDSLINLARYIPYDSVEAIRRDKGFYYKDYLDSLMRASQKLLNKKKPRRTANYDFLKTIFNSLVWIVAIGVLVFLVYRLFLSNSTIFTRNRSNANALKVVLNDEIPEDPDTEIRNSIRRNDYRSAVRFLYLKLLKQLAEKNLIDISSTKTDYQYMDELKTRSFADAFASLVLKYEYVWYGGYPLDKTLFETVHTSFKEFYKTIDKI